MNQKMEAINMPSDWSEPINVLDYPVFLLIFSFSLIVISLAGTFICLNIYNWWAHWWKHNKIRTTKLMELFLIKQLRIAKNYKINDGKTSYAVAVLFFLYLCFWLGLIISFFFLYLFHIFRPSNQIKSAFNVWFVIIIVFYHTQWVSVFIQYNIVLSSYNEEFPSFGKIYFKSLENKSNYFNVIPKLNKKGNCCNLDNVFVTILDIDVIKEVSVTFENHYNEYQEVEIESEIKRFSIVENKKEFYTTIFHSIQKTHSKALLRCITKDNEIILIIFNNGNPCCAEIPIKYLTLNQYQTYEETLIKNWHLRINRSLKKRIKQNQL